MLHFAAGPAKVQHMVVLTQTHLRDVPKQDAKTSASSENPQQGVCIAWHFPDLLGEGGGKEKNWKKKKKRTDFPKNMEISSSTLVEESGHTCPMTLRLHLANCAFTIQQGCCLFQHVSILNY